MLNTNNESAMSVEARKAALELSRFHREVPKACSIRRPRFPTD